MDFALSSYSVATGVIFEGWLEKKSRRSGMWKRRYYVLHESSRDFAVLRVYNRVVETAWGTVPLQFKSEFRIQHIAFVTNCPSKGTPVEFSICISVRGNNNTNNGGNNNNNNNSGSGAQSFLPSPSKLFSSSRLSFSNLSNWDSKNGSKNRSGSRDRDSSSVCSDDMTSNNNDDDDYVIDGSTRVLRLRAPNSQTRLLWVTILDKLCKEAFEEETAEES